VSAFTKFQKFGLNLGKAEFNFSSDTLKIMLTDTGPSASSNALYSDISGNEIANGNGYTTGGSSIASVGWSQSGGTSTLSGNAVVWTASGGAIAQFRYCVAYDSTTGYLIGYWDYGSEVNITSGNTFTINENSQSTGGTILTIA
jgi:hypothetical protein